MAESVHRSSDVPNYDTYPLNPSDEVTDWSVARASVGRSSLEQRAAELGAAVGRIAVIMRQTKEGMENLAQHEIYDRVTNLAENAKIRTEHIRRMAADRVQEITHTAQDKVIELGDLALERTVEVGRQARANYFRARLKANQTVREHPVETALAAGAIGLLVGVALRIGRAKRAY